MADSGDHKRLDVSPLSRPASKKIRLRPQVLEQPADHIPTHSKKSLKRSATAGGKSNEQAVRDQLPDHTTMARESSDSMPTKSSTLSTDRVEGDRTPSIKDMSSPENIPLPEPDRPIDTSTASLANESEGSSGSCETVTLKQDSSGKTTSVKPKKHPISKPNVLNFLDLDSPQVTPESIQRTVKEASKPSPETPKNTSPSAHSTSSASSGFREDVFDIFGDHETDRSTSPEHGIDEDSRARVFGEAGPRTAKTNKSRKRYGTPEMPRVNAQYPHVPPEELTPRAPNQQFFKRLPRAEKLPLTGYELLASRLSSLSADRGGQLRPIYRRFEALNHRILLHLQDEICELEEKLHRLDTADTQNRRLPNGILPASRRAEFVSGGEFQWHKADILGQIAWKLDQYSKRIGYSRCSIAVNHDLDRVLSSFRETLSLPPPTMPAISQYRGFLANYTPISEVETQFLDATDDLVCLSYSDDDEMIADEEDVATPVSRSDITDFHTRRRVSILSQSDTSRQLDERNTPSSDPERVPLDQQHTTAKYLLMCLSVAMAVAVILPILTFLVIPGFIGRMTVVGLVGTGILVTLVQGSWVKFQATQEFCLSVGLYGCVMAVLAGMVN
ncbi:hypothetical protein FHL15_006515 [Xylaria flabelliformis]|uniref:DUF6594 domain-containing protein n=1 Tax=Xylaria flabelliformis TaxID=2512241 RepID=A0A553HXB3_9PEZI|nr:hypothetical protein FHL15_006515 [Xylaria flabelliformis]